MPGTKPRCPKCESGDVYCASAATVYQRFEFMDDGELDYEAYDSEDVEFEGEGSTHYVCLACFYRSPNVMDFAVRITA
jgi:hypothetical protein